MPAEAGDTGHAGESAGGRGEQRVQGTRGQQVRLRARSGQDGAQ